MRDHQGAVSLHVIPPVFLLLLAGVLSASDVSWVAEPRLLLPTLSTLFASLLPLVIAMSILRGYIAERARPFLLAGCGMVTSALGSFVGGWSLVFETTNFGVTVHNLGFLFGGACNLCAALMLSHGSSSPRLPPRAAAARIGVFAYAASAATMALTAILAREGALPVFFTDSGATLTRQAVLTFGAISYAFSALLLLQLSARTGMQFLSLWANALFLTAIGLIAFLMLKSTGSLLSWTGRISLYVGNLYFLFALAVGRKETSSRAASLPSYLTELFRSRLESEVKGRTSALLELNERFRGEIEVRREAEVRLRESEETYRSVIENSLQGIAIIQDGRIVLCNEALCRISGYTKEEIFHQTMEQVLATVHAEDRARVAEALASLAVSALPPASGVLRLVDKAGHLHWVEVLAGGTLYNGSPAVQVSYVDITERRRAESAYRTLVEKALDGYAIIVDGKVVFANAALAQICGYEVSALLRMTAEEISSLVHPDDRQRILKGMWPRPEVAGAVATQRFRFRHRDGSWRTVEIQSVPVEHEGRPAIQVAYRDVTEAQAAQNELNATHHKMRNLAAHLLRVREEERRKVAQEVHDDLGQTLAALKMDLHWLEKRFRGASPATDKRLKGMIELGEQAIGIVQRVSSELRPRMLDDLGLAPALEWLAADFSRRTRLPCALSVDVSPGRIGGNAATTIYRFVQEALTNVARHSLARHAAVRLFARDGEVLLEVEDDGIGITPGQASAPDSFGQIGMRERVEGLGGILSVEGQPGRGTLLSAHIPFPAEGGLA